MATFTSKFLKKQFVLNGELKAVSDRASQFVASLKKIRRGGSSIAEPIILSGPKGNSFSFTAAQFVAQQGGGGDEPPHAASNYDEWNSTFGQYIGYAQVSARAMAGAQNDKDAYLRQVAEVLTSEVTAFVEIGARKLLGPVGGSIGQVTNVSTNGVPGAFTLSKASDAYNFVVGMVLNAATTDGSTAPGAVKGGGTPTTKFVIQVFPDGDNPAAPGAQVFISDTSGGTVSNSATAFANADFLFRHGDLTQGTDLSDQQIRSLQSWVTLVAATDTKFTVDRSRDSRLSGFRVPSAQLAGFSILDRIQLLATVGSAQAAGKGAKMAWVGPKTWQQLATEAQSYGTIQFTNNITLGVDALTVMTCNGPTQVMTDPHVVESDIWLLTPDNVVLYQYGDSFPELFTYDGQELLRVNNAMAGEMRWTAFTCLTVNGRPQSHGRCDSGNLA